MGSVVPLPCILDFPRPCVGKASLAHLLENRSFGQTRHTDHKGKPSGARYATSSQDVYRQKDLATHTAILYQAQVLICSVPLPPDFAHGYLKAPYWKIYRYTDSHLFNCTPSPGFCTRLFDTKIQRKIGDSAPFYLIQNYKEKLAIALPFI